MLFRAVLSVVANISYSSSVQLCQLLWTSPTALPSSSVSCCEHLTALPSGSVSCCKHLLQLFRSVLSVAVSISYTYSVQFCLWLRSTFLDHVCTDSYRFYVYQGHLARLLLDYLLTVIFHCICHDICLHADCRWCVCVCVIACCIFKCTSSKYCIMLSTYMELSCITCEMGHDALVFAVILLCNCEDCNVLSAFNLCCFCASNILSCLEWRPHWVALLCVAVIYLISVW